MDCLSVMWLQLRCTSPGALHRVGSCCPGDVRFLLAPCSLAQLRLCGSLVGVGAVWWKAEGLEGRAGREAVHKEGPWLPAPLLQAPTPDATTLVSKQQSLASEGLSEPLKSPWEIALAPWYSG